MCVKLSVGNYIMNFGCVADINKWEVSGNKSCYFASRKSPMKGYKHIDPDHCGLLRSAHVIKSLTKLWGLSAPALSVEHHQL